MPVSFSLAVEAPDDNTLKIIGDGLTAYNQQQFPHPPADEFVVTARGDDGEVLGGAWCFHGSKVLFVRWLWVAEHARGGTGSAVLERAHDHGRTLGAALVYLDTFSFQARGFYEKLGYECFGTLDYPESDVQRFWMKKLL
jgi:GNAT superfamily N-acetyltransferase